MRGEEGYFSPASLRLARESRGRSQTDLANELKVSQGKVSKWEDGLLPITSADVQRIGEALGYPEAFFLQENRFAELSTSCLFHRRRKSLSPRSLKQIHACVNISRGRVERLLRNIDDFPVKFRRFQLTEFGSPGAVSRAVRTVWNVPRGPIKNLVALIEAAGGVVIPTDFGTAKLDAISQWPEGGVPLFFMNRHMSADRMRFTLAHEVGHVFMHGSPTADPEREADAFASEFLIPEAEAKVELKDLTLAKAAALKPRWGVSIAAIVRKAFDTGAISESRYTSLNVQISQNGIRKVEPFPLPPERPTTLDRLIALHRKELGYTKARLASLVTSLPERLASEFHPPE